MGGVVATIFTAIIGAIISHVQESKVNSKISAGAAPLHYEPFRECPDYFNGQMKDGSLKTISTQHSLNDCMKDVLKSTTLNEFSDKICWNQRSKQCSLVMNNNKIYHSNSDLLFCQLQQHYPRPSYLNGYENIINIAVTGVSGVGKSTFINTVRGLTAKDEGAAPVGVEETTMEPTPYKFHFKGLDIILWDMPGCGTMTHPKETYIMNMGLKYFDNVLFLNSARFRQCDVDIARELKDISIPHYFIKTKSNVDFRNEEDDHDKSPEEVKQYISERMKNEQGIDKVYFVGKYSKRRSDPYKEYYDYDNLMKEFLCNLFKNRATNVPIPKECKT